MHTPHKALGRRRLDRRPRRRWSRLRATGTRHERTTRRRLLPTQLIRPWLHRRVRRRSRSRRTAWRRSRWQLRRRLRRSLLRCQLQSWEWRLGQDRVGTRTVHLSSHFFGTTRQIPLGEHLRVLRLRWSRPVIRLWEDMRLLGRTLVPQQVAEDLLARRPCTRTRRRWLRGPQVL